MRVGLYGIGGVYNFGCEAIVRGATKLFTDINSKNEIIYYTYNYEYDTKVLADLAIKIVPVPMRNNFARKLINKGLSVLNADHRVQLVDVEDICKNIDILVSIGGDIYTIPQVLRSQETYPYYNSLVDFCAVVNKYGIPVVLYGASVGPFGRYKKAIQYYSKNLKEYKIILARENRTMDYLDTIGVNNSIFFPDPAFTVEASENEITEKKYIGFNFSPLSIKEVYGVINDNAVNRICQIIQSVYKETGKDILLIPHVISKNPNDDDLQFLKHVQNGLSEDTKTHSLIANYRDGFLGVKAQLRQCNVVVSARMHCAINAIVESVPSIMVSYSQKTVGMTEFVYGNKKWFINLAEIETIPEKVKALLEEAESTTDFLIDRNQEIREYYQSHLHQVAEALSV